MRTGCILLTALSLSFPGYGLIYVVPSGETETTPIILPDDGDQALIEKGGTLSTGASTAVTMNNDNQTTRNKGLISTTGDNAYGILNQNGANAVITNCGNISTTGNSAYGIFNDDGANAVITNCGNISTTEIAALGIFNNSGANAVITNCGNISTTQLVAHGIYNLNGDNAVIINCGNILTTGSNAHGILNQNGDNAVITNCGNISTTGNTAHGIFNLNSDNTHIINSGTIRSAQSFSLLFQDGTNPTLTLLRGSNLQGPVEVTGDTLNLNVETGLNLALTLTAVSTGFNNLGIEAPFVLSGDTIAVIDPTGLTLQTDVIADLSDIILSNIYRYRLDCCNSCDCGLWAQGIGSYRKRSHDHNHVGYDNWQGGFLIGYNRPLCCGSGSFFAGASFGAAEVDEHTQKGDVNSYFGGLTYETCLCDTFVGLALAVGYIDWDNARYVMNNLASGGVETARAAIDGVFISPELTLARQFSSFWCHPVASFTLRYAGFFPGSYRERGSVADLSIKDREIDLLTTRFEVAVPYTDQCGRYCWNMEPYIGVFGRYQVGGYRVDGKLLGQSIHFNQQGPRNLAALLLGFRGIQSFDCLNLFLNVEASFDTASSARILGEGGIGWNF